MALLSVQTVSRAGATPSYAAANGGGDTFVPDKDTFLHVKNGGGGAITVTVVTPRSDAIGNVIADNAVSVTNGQERMIGPFPYEHYADPSTGVANISYSGVASVTVGAFRVVEP